MISSVSGINFKGDAPVNNLDLINSPGKFTTAGASKAETPKADSFEKEGAEETKKSKAPAIIGTVVALLAAAYIGLSVAVGKGKLTKKVAADGAELKFSEKVNNFFHSIGESGNNLWKKIRGKNTEDEAPAPKPGGEEPAKPAGDSEAPKADASEPKETQTPNTAQNTADKKPEENK